MKFYRIIGYFLIGTIVYILVETFVGIESKQFHIENSQYPQLPAGGANVVASGIGTPTVYGSSKNYS